MKREELIKLKKIYNQELEKRARINQLLQEDNVLEYLKLNGINPERLQIEDKWSIIKEILNDFNITETNKILVCIGTFITDFEFYYDYSESFPCHVPFDHPDPQYRIYKDIESGAEYKGYFDKRIKSFYETRQECYKDLLFNEYFQRCYKNGQLISELMQKYTILNPYNSSKNQNGYEEVRKDFFETAITKGQPSAKKLILSKYPLMK